MKIRRSNSKPQFEGFVIALDNKDLLADRRAQGGHHEASFYYREASSVDPSFFAVVEVRPRDAEQPNLLVILEKADSGRYVLVALTREERIDFGPYKLAEHYREFFADAFAVVVEVLDLQPNTESHREMRDLLELMLPPRRLWIRRGSWRRPVTSISDDEVCSASGETSSKRSVATSARLFPFGIGVTSCSVVDTKSEGGV